MASDSEHADPVPAPATIEMPRPTIWPLVLALGVTLILGGLVINFVFTFLGMLLGIGAAYYWVYQTVPDIGETHQQMTHPRASPVVSQPGTVELMRPGVPGYRMQMPEKIHPYSAGLKGGIYAGIAMTIPALIYGLLSHSIWFPINLLAGMAMDLTDEAGKVDMNYMVQFHFGLLILATFIHATISIFLGLMYGVILPMLPRRQFFWGVVVAPILWTGMSYGFMGVLNPALQEQVYWPAFFASQFVYGVVVHWVVTRSEQVYVQAQPEYASPPQEGGNNP